MKKLILLLALSGSVNLYSQEFQTILDFEGQLPNLVESFGGAGEVQIVSNPDQSGVNTSSNVLQFTKQDASEVWGGIVIGLENGYIDFNGTNQIKINSYSPETGKVIKIKLETQEGNVDGLTHEVDMVSTVANQWEVLTYDFSEAPDLQYSRFVIFYDFGNTTSGVYHFDDIQVDENEYTINNNNFQLNITADPSDNWTGFMQVYEFDGTYAFGNTWNIEDLKTTLDLNSQEIILQPNFNAYDSDDPYWVNEDGSGNKIMEAITQVESTTAFNNKEIIFSASVHSYTLDQAYTARFFVRALDPNNNYVDITEGQYSTIIGDEGNFSIIAPPFESGMLVQYGFTIFGPVANPDLEEELGSVMIKPETYVDPCPLELGFVYSNLSNESILDDDDDGFAEFNLSSLLLPLEESYSITYHQSLVDAETAVNALISPYINTTPESQTIYARVEDPNIEGCFVIVPINLIVQPNFDLLPVLISSNWRIHYEIPAHRGLGNPETFTSDYFSAPAYEAVAANYGMIDDFVSFSEDGVFTYDTGVDGSISGKKPEIDNSFDPEGTNAYAPDNEYNEYTNYVLEGFSDGFTIGFDGTYKTITFDSNGGFQFYTAIAPQTYQVLEITENSLHLRNIGSENFAWYVKLTNTVPCEVYSISNDISATDYNEDGIEIFDLTSAIGIIEDSFVVSYYVSIEDAETSSNPIVDPTSFEGTAQEIYIRVEDSSLEECYIIDSFFTVINEINLNDFLTQNPLLRVEAETYGHFGVGPVGELSPIYYGAEPNEKEGLGMYNDLYYFNPNGPFRVFTSGDIFGKAAAITQAFGNDEGLIENQFGEFENYPIEDINSNWIVNSENSSQINLSENGFLGFFHEGGLTYDLISSDENSITLGTYPSWDAPNRWFITLTSEGVNSVLSIESPLNNQVFDYNTEQVIITYSETYGQTDFLQYSVNNGDVVNTNIGDFSIDVVPGQTYEVVVSLTDSNFEQLSPAISDTITFSVANTPTLTITSPENLQEFPNGTSSVEIAYSTTDFIISEQGGDGYIQFEFEGNAPINVYDSSQTVIDFVELGIAPTPTDLGDEYSVTATLFDNEGVSLEISEQFTFIVSTIFFNVAGSELGDLINSDPYGTYTHSVSYNLDGFELGVDGSIEYNVTYYAGNYNSIGSLDEINNDNLDEQDSIQSESLIVSSVEVEGEELNYDLRDLFTLPGAGLYKRTYTLVDNENNPLQPFVEQVSYQVMIMPSLSYEEIATNGSIFPNDTTIVNINFSVGDFGGPADGLIEYSINDSDTVSLNQNIPLSIDVEAGQDYSLTAYLVDEFSQPVYPSVSTEYTFSVAGNTQVTDGIYWVDETVFDESSSTGSEDNPFKNIQTAINTASNLDTVMVRPGVYTENISLDDKYVTITTPNPTTSASTTIIDGGSNGISVLDINGLGLNYSPDEESSITISGFSIRNGLTASNEVPSGIWVHSTSNIDLGINFENLIIEENTSTDAAAVYLYYTANNRKMKFKNVVFRENNATQTFAGFNQESEMNGCEFYNNSGNQTIRFWHNGTTHYSIIKNSIIRDNTTSNNLELTDGILINSTIINNSSQNYFSGNSAIVNSIIGTGQFVTNEGLLNVSNSHIEDGSFSIINQITNFLTYENNSEGEILFTDIVNKDYSLTDYSPAIGGGLNSIELYESTYEAPTNDFLGNTRPNPEGSNVDMGAFENSLAESVHNTNIYVSTTGTDEDTVGTEDNPFLTIQAAVNYAITGDNILVNPGEYVEKVLVVNKSVNLTAVEPLNSSIVLPNTGITLEFSSNIGTLNSIIDGFNIYPNTPNIGGSTGIKPANEHFITIKNSVVSNFDQNAIATSISSAIAYNTVFKNNSNVIWQDNGTNAGVEATFYNCTMIDNGQIHWVSSATVTGTFINTIMIGRYQQSQDFSEAQFNNTPTFNKVISDNINIIPSGNSDWQLAPEGFADMYFTDHENGDYTLQNTSPAIGYGYYPMPTDIMGNSRPAPLGSNVDIGAFESDLGVPNNAPPRMDVINNVFINEDEELNSFYITGIVDGDIREIQTLSFTIDSNNNDLFEVLEVQYDQGQSLATVNYKTNLDIFGSADVTINLTDDAGTENDAVNFTSQTFTIDVEAVNDAPTEIILVDGNSLNENTSDITVDIFSTLDVDDNTFTYELATGEGDSDNTKFTVDGSSLVVSTPFDYETQEQASIRVKTTDSGGLTHEEVLIVQINDLNDAAVAQNQTVTTDEDTLLAITLAGTDIENDPLEYFISSSPTNGTLYQTEDGITISAALDVGSIVTNSSNIVLFEPFENAYGDSYAVFNYFINDSNQDSEIATITVNVNPVNDSPTAISINNDNLNENEQITVGQLFTSDVDQEDTFDYEFINGIGDTDNGLFGLTGTQNNLLYNLESFNYEDQTQYSIRIRSFNDNDSIEQQFIINVLNVNDINITTSTQNTYCEGELANGSISINEINETLGNLTFTWTGPNGYTSTDQSVDNLSPGTYELNLSDEFYSYDESFIINQEPIYNDLEICYITSDEENFTNNRIYFNSEGNYNVATYEVLRETSAIDVYESIGFVLPSESSFLDNTSNNQQQQYKYKVRSVDACGNASDLSSYHSNTLLQANLAAGGSVNLNWEEYEGVDYSTFYIYRSVDDGAFELLNALPSNQFNYNDTGADTATNNYKYYVGILVEDCTTTRNIFETVTLRSNLLSIVDGALTNGEFDFENSINIFPNPTNNIVRVKLSDTIELNKIEVFNNIGQLLVEIKTNVVSLKDYSSGLYFFKVFTSKGIVIKKVIKE